MGTTESPCLNQASQNRELGVGIQPFAENNSVSNIEPVQCTSEQSEDTFKVKQCANRDFIFRISDPNNPDCGFENLLERSDGEVAKQIFTDFPDIESETHRPKNSEDGGRILHSGIHSQEQGENSFIELMSQNERATMKSN